MATMCNEQDTCIDRTSVSWTGAVAGSVPGNFTKGSDGEFFYKLSAYNHYDLVYGHESVNEVLVSNLLEQWGIDHITYYGEQAKVRLGDKEFETYLCKSRFFGPEYKTAISLEHYQAILGLDGDDIIKKFPALRTMFFFDYVIANRDRHGANIDLIRDGDDFKIFPFYDHGCSIMSPQQNKWKEVSVEEFSHKDMTVNNHLGSFSLEYNLLEYCQDVEIPDFFPDDLIYNGLEYADQELVKKAIAILEGRFDNARELLHQGERQHSR